MKLKRYPKNILMKNYMVAEHHFKPTIEYSEPHKIVTCVACNSVKINFHRSGDDLLYYICACCGFESEEMGPAPAYIT